ncbi:MAG: amino acid ABC transporter permease [Alphaproteobacteria bacterium]|nr:amino acid ABC transporter permease [Alphaproteobacteria bacterium]MDP6815736.1 amino acid ABC transporter permease [Alphaproteobacteria bacterium]
MTAADVGVKPGKANFLYDARVRAIAYQIITAAGLVIFIAWLTNNTLENLEARGIASGFEFLGHPAGFGVPFSLIDYSEASPYKTAFYLSVLNTLFVSIVGIVLATIVGFAMGVMRLSKNFLISRIAAIYLETFRNVPLLLQILFWYIGVLQLMPKIRSSLIFFDNVYVNNRGIFYPSLTAETGFSAIPVAFGLGILATIAMRIWAKRRQEATGQSFHTVWVGLGLIVGAPVMAAIVTGFPWTWSIPKLVGFGFNGGAVIVPEFLALLLALTIYTAAFIGEIVRAGIQAVSHGQTEAAHALGLRHGVTLRLVIIPQAMRIIIPPLISQYLNLTKNSSLAPAIGYPELTAVWAGTVLNQSGQALECMAMVMGVYCAISLSISGVMNWYNKRVALVER